MSPRVHNLLFLIAGAVAVAAVVVVLSLTGGDSTTRQAVAQTTPAPATGAPAGVADIYGASPPAWSSWPRAGPAPARAS